MSSKKSERKKERKFVTYQRKRFPWEKPSLTNLKDKLDKAHRNNLTPHGRAMANPRHDGGMLDLLLMAVGPAADGPALAVRHVCINKHQLSITYFPPFDCVAHPNFCPQIENSCPWWNWWVFQDTCSSSHQPKTLACYSVPLMNYHHGHVQTRVGRMWKSLPHPQRFWWSNYNNR